MSLALASGAHRTGFSRFVDALLAYLLFVIVFGAWVRVTGSGAGCGDHWPTCHGQLVPRSASVETLIEYTHRLTSGLLGVMAIALPLWARRQHPSGHPVVRLAWATLALIVVEAGIGAGLVLQGLVADDSSSSRALVVALHLGNTLLLTACAALTALHARAPDWLDRPTWARQGRFKWALLGLCSLFALVACSGAVTALGDTLFPVDESPPPDHFLVQLRVVHPLLACLLAAFAAWVSARLSEHRELRVVARALAVLVALQVVIGGLEIALAAPGYLQLLHLLVAQLAWMAAVLGWAGWARLEPGNG